MGVIEVALIDYMGDDTRVVNAARVSFNRDRRASSPDLIERDSKLIRYLARHNHWTPFGHCVITMRETVPVFIARQRFKHTVGFVYNEISRRYVDEDPEFYVPDRWRARAPDKKQGSVEGSEVRSYGQSVTPSSRAEAVYELAFTVYREMLEGGVCPEQARMVLPQSMMTSYYVTGSLAAWARAYKLRSHADAQAEIRRLATEWSNIIAPLFPVSWGALTEESSYG
mgnify:CR=1 FL=1